MNITIETGPALKTNRPLQAGDVIRSRYGTTYLVVDPDPNLGIDKTKVKVDEKVFGLVVAEEPPRRGMVGKVCVVTSKERAQTSQTFERFPNAPITIKLEK